MRLGTGGTGQSATARACRALVRWAAIAAALPAAGIAAGQLVDPEKGTRDGSPLDDLPPHIRLVTAVGMRPDWSPDGTKLLYLDRAPLGDVWRIDVATGGIRRLTRHFPHRGFTRAQYLKNGDILLCGPTSGPQPSAARPEAGRFTAVASVLRSAYPRRPPQPLGIPCWEGIVASRQSMRIAWNRSDIDYTDDDLFARVIFGISELWTGRIRFIDGRATLVDVAQRADRTAVSPIAVLEAQAFRPRAEHELIFTAYAHQGGEVMGLDFASGAVRNYSNSPLYEEVEGVSPDGRWALVERDLESTLMPGPLDIWRLSLDSRSTWERLTYFNRYRGGHYASNPTVHPSGRRFAFQLSFDGPTEGEGRGILIFDLERYTNPPP
jgi:hypothetical protein